MRASVQGASITIEGTISCHSVSLSLFVFVQSAKGLVGLTVREKFVPARGKKSFSGVLGKQVVGRRMSEAQR